MYVSCNKCVFSQIWITVCANVVFRGVGTTGSGGQGGHIFHLEKYEVQNMILPPPFPHTFRQTFWKSWLFGMEAKTAPFSMRFEGMLCVSFEKLDCPQLKYPKFRSNSEACPLTFGSTHAAYPYFPVHAYASGT